MKNGTYKAQADLTVWGLFSMADVGEGQMVVISDGDHDDTASVECGPFCTVEVKRDHNFSNLELVD